MRSSIAFNEAPDTPKRDRARSSNRGASRQISVGDPFCGGGDRVDAAAECKKFRIEARRARPATSDDGERQRRSRRGWSGSKRRQIGQVAPHDEQQRRRGSDHGLDVQRSGRRFAHLHHAPVCIRRNTRAEIRSMSPAIGHALKDVEQPVTLPADRIARTGELTRDTGCDAGQAPVPGPDLFQKVSLSVAPRPVPVPGNDPLACADSTTIRAAALALTTSRTAKTTNAIGWLRNGCEEGRPKPPARRALRLERRRAAGRRLRRHQVQGVCDRR